MPASWSVSPFVCAVMVWEPVPTAVGTYSTLQADVAGEVETVWHCSGASRPGPLVLNATSLGVVESLAVVTVAIHAERPPTTIVAGVHWIVVEV